MAITKIDYFLMRNLREAGLLKLDGSLIEFGEANWYGDVSLDQLRADIDAFALPGEVQALKDKLQQIEGGQSNTKLFDVAKIFYQCFLQNSSHFAIDLSGTSSSLKLNLNEPLPDCGQYDVLIDFGTAEHVFDLRQFFANAHDVTLPGGLMIHGLPWTGWIDHGFYNFQPTLFFDLAAANDYKIHTVSCACLNPFELRSLNTRENFIEFAKTEQIATNSLIYAVFSKPETHKPFRVPMQGYYSGTLSRDLMQAWKTMR